MTNLIQVQVTAGTRDEADQIADKLLHEKLAACVQVSGPISSRYWWQGSLDESVEWMCLVKSRADLFSRIEASIQEVHSYDQPEILATAIVAGSQGYIDWVNAVTLTPSAS